MKNLSSQGQFKRLMVYAQKTFNFGLNPQELQKPAKYKSYSPVTGIFPVFSGLLTGCNSATQIEKHMEEINKKLGKVSSPSRSTIGSLLDEDRTLSYLNNRLIGLFHKANTLRSLKVKEYGNLIVALIDGVDLGEVFHQGGKCDLCLERRYKSGEIRYFHKVVVLTVMSKQGPIPIYYRFVRQTELTIKLADTSEERFKQECELSCAKKILTEVAALFGGKLPFNILGGDALFANAPFMEGLEALGAAGIFVFNQENRKLYKQAKADFCGETLGFNISRMEWNNSIGKEISYESLSGTYVDNNRKNEGKNVKIFETTRTNKNGKSITGMAICSDRRFVNPQLVELIRVGRWHDLENGVFNSLENGWDTLKHIFFHNTNAMQSMIALQLISLVISLFYRFSNLKRGNRKFTGTLKDFFKHMYHTFRLLRKKTLSDIMCNSPPI